MKTYLSDDKIKGLKKYLNQAIPKDTQEVLKKLTTEGLDLFETTESNKLTMWHYYNDKVRKLNNEETREFSRLANCGNFSGMGDIVKKYIEKNHKKENELISAFSPDGIRDKLYGIQGLMKENHCINDDNLLNVKELVYAESFDIYLTRYDIKNVDKDLLKQADKMANDIDSVYNPKVRNQDSYDRYLAGQREYFLTGDRNKLFNIMNKEY